MADAQITSSQQPGSVWQNMSRAQMALGLVGIAVVLTLMQYAGGPSARRRCH